MKRVFLIVLDSLGIGAMPDAECFGDTEPNTLKRISASQNFNVPNLIKMGLGNIDGVDCIPAVAEPIAAHARMTEASAGKDTTIGHWEIAGVVSHTPLPTYPNGFPDEIISEFSRLTGRGILCNKPYSGTQVIYDYGKEHIETGKLIVYTSADSVFQIAAHEEVVPVEELYKYSKIARELLRGKHGVGRVIARPFIGSFPNFKRTANRHDFSLVPPSHTLLDTLCDAGKDVIGIGKISDIFAGRGITKNIHTVSNADGMQKTLDTVKEDFCGLCFVNLVEFDSHYGHRQDIDGYAKALSEFDAWLPKMLEAMGEDDALILTADHGCDPGDDHTDHTREYTPVLIYNKNIKATNLGTKSTFADIAATVAHMLYCKKNFKGESML